MAAFSSEMVPGSAKMAGGMGERDMAMEIRVGGGSVNELRFAEYSFELAFGWVVGGKSLQAYIHFGIWALHVTEPAYTFWYFWHGENHIALDGVLFSVFFFWFI